MEIKQARVPGDKTTQWDKEDNSQQVKKADGTYFALEVKMAPSIYMGR